MLSYHNDPQLKEDFVNEIIKHREADQVLKGTYGAAAYDFSGGGVSWQGCAVACSLRSLKILKGESTLNIVSYSNHKLYETEIGVSEELAYIEDAIFEELPAQEAKYWPEKFAEAIPVGVDLELMEDKFRDMVKEEFDREREAVAENLGNTLWVQGMAKEEIEDGIDSWLKTNSATKLLKKLFAYGGREPESIASEFAGKLLKLLREEEGQKEEVDSIETKPKVMVQRPYL